MKHCESGVFVDFLNVKPPVENFLATILLCNPACCIPT